MLWFFVAFVAQAILGTSAVFDKLLLKKSYPNPLGYAFWLGVLGLVSLVLVPFGFEWALSGAIFTALSAGAVFMLAMMAYFRALCMGEASGAVVAFVGFSPIATLVFSRWLLGTDLTAYQIVSFVLLIAGGFVLALVVKERTRVKVLWAVLLAASFLGLSNVLSKLAFGELNFVTGFVWIKIGGALFAFSLLLLPRWKKIILNPNTKNEFHNKWGYFANRGYAGVGSLLVVYAISLGVPPLVDALQGIKIVFILLGGWLLLHERFTGRVLVGKITAVVLILLGAFVLGVGDYIRSTAPVNEARPITWGITYSEKFSRLFDFGSGGDWKDNYNAIMYDLGVRDIRLIAYWDLIESEEGVYDFSGLDYQMRVAEEVGAKVVLAVGKKVPRWPECHTPPWAEHVSHEDRNEHVVRFVEATVERYKNSPALLYWQVENEPFLAFGEGECALSEKELLDTEMGIVRRIDPLHPILVTDSGEIGPWVRAAKRGDVFGTTMYRRVHNDRFGNFEYPLPPAFFRLKERLVRFIIRDYEKEFIVIELGMEPWLKRQPYETTPEEQFRVMDFAFFQDSIRYAKEADFETYYLWGGEWWYWLREQHNDDRFWEEAKLLFEESA